MGELVKVGVKNSFISFELMGVLAMCAYILARRHVYLCIEIVCYSYHQLISE